MATLIDKIKQIHNLAKEYALFRLDEDRLLDFFNDKFTEELAPILNLYSDATLTNPINFLRKKVASQLSGNKALTPEWFTDQIKEIEVSTNKKSFKAYSTFSILYPFLHKLNPVDVKGTLTTLGNSIIKKLGIGDSVNDPHVVNFRGPRSFGSDRVWMAIYNRSHPNQTTALQFFFLIDHQGFKCTFYDRFLDAILDQKIIEIDGDLVKEVEVFFAPYVRELRGNSYKSLKNRILGIKGQRFFKLSHGVEHFGIEEIQYCLSNSIAVVHEKTKAKGRSSLSQYEIFKSAKRGDFFFSSWGNNNLLVIGQFVDEQLSDYEYIDNPQGWKQRKYRQIYVALLGGGYKGAEAWWTPSHNSTFVEINQKDFDKANKNLFVPFFKVELDPNTPAQIFGSRRGIASDIDTMINDRGNDPKLDVTLVSSEFARLIYNLQNNKGQFLGIFGRWGRGKTFFAEKVFESINLSTDSTKIRKHKAIVFNAWKYQDTEATWAYIYEVLLNAYLDVGGEDRWARKRLLRKLNFARKGKWPVWSLGISIFFSLVWVILIPFAWKLAIVFFVLSIFGLFGTLLLRKMYLKYYPKVKDMVKEYHAKPGFETLLGAQAEVQEEIKILLKTWFELRTHIKQNESKGKKIWKRDYDRLIFFIDDIDRCSEEKIISIIDSLRVMLEDEEIIEKIIVVAAVDENILERAVIWKYKDLLDLGSQKLMSDSKSFKDLNELTREYLDKLFIGGIKLPALSENEINDILENYALNAEILERNPYLISAEIVQESNEQEELIDEDSEQRSLVFPESIYDDYVISQKQYFLLQTELELLQSNIAKNTDKEITPRQLRIYLNRYLLAKNIAAGYLYKETGENELSSHYCEFIIEAIAKKTFDYKYEIDKLKLEEININPRLRTFTDKLIKMVVPY